MKRETAKSIAKQFKISEGRALEAMVKAQLIASILKTVGKEGITHAELAEKSGLTRSVVTGILSGSLQQITIDRILRLVAALDLTTEIKLKKVI